MKEAREPFSNRGERNKEANKHRNDKGNLKVDGQVGPIEMRRGNHGAREGEGETNKEIDDEVVEKFAKGDFHGCEPSGKHTG